jgi:hypothetical protein
MWAGVWRVGGKGGSEGGGRKDGRGGEGEGGGGGGGGRRGWEGGGEEGRGGRGQGELRSGIWGRAMTEAGTEDDGRLGGDWLRRLRLWLWCGWGGGPWRGPGVKQRETVGCAASQVCVWGKWAGDARVGRARADGSGGWEGDEEWKDPPLRR